MNNQESLAQILEDILEIETIADQQSISTNKIVEFSGSLVATQLQKYKDEVVYNKGEREIIANQFQDSFYRSINNFLIQKHGSNDGFSPNAYSIGSKQHHFQDTKEEAEEIIDMAIKNTIPQIQYGDSKEDIETMKRLVEEEGYGPIHIKALAYVAGIKGEVKEKIINEMIENRVNIKKPTIKPNEKQNKLPGYILGLGKNVSERKIRLLEDKLFTYNNLDELNELLDQEIKPLGAYKKEAITKPEEINMIFRKIYDIMADKHEFFNNI